MTKRIYPNFFIVGAMKAGTSTLYNYLNLHPDVYMSPIKEPHFFSNLRTSQNPRYSVKIISNEIEYLDLFKKVTNEKVIGEASTSYLWNEKTASLLKKKIPHAKIIILLRNPIDRAYSHYLMDVREGRQNLSFIEALEEDIERKEKAYGISHLYVELGMYHTQVKKYLTTFNHEPIHIIMFEDLVERTFDSLIKAAKFLNIDPMPFYNINLNKIYNEFKSSRTKLSRLIISSARLRDTSRKLIPQSVRSFVYNYLLLKKRKKPILDNQAKSFLINLYEDDVDKLEKLLKMESNNLSSLWFGRRSI